MASPPPKDSERPFITQAKFTSEANNTAIGYSKIYASAGLIQRVEAWLETFALHIHPPSVPIMLTQTRQVIESALVRVSANLKFLVGR
jgi:hypothetical protein